MIFKDNYDFETRKSESNKILNKYPSRIPVIVNKSEDCILDDIDKKKYLVPKDLKMSQFLYVIRKRIQLKPSESIFLMTNNQLCPSNTDIIHIYEKFANKDGFLYIQYTSENTFG